MQWSKMIGTVDSNLTIMFGNLLRLRSVNKSFYLNKDLVESFLSTESPAEPPCASVYYLSCVLLALNVSSQCFQVNTPTFGLFPCCIHSKVLAHVKRLHEEMNYKYAQQIGFFFFFADFRVGRGIGSSGEGTEIKRWK